MNWMNRTKKPILMSALVALALWLPVSAMAIEPDEILADPALETRAREVSKGLRCVVCQNQSIDDSNAELARDMRILVRDRIFAGDSNQQVTDYMVDRYGDYVLLSPPMKPSTYLLWFGPVLIFGLGMLAVIFFYRRRPAAGTPGAPQEQSLSNAEKEKLKDLMKGDDA